MEKIDFVNNDIPALNARNLNKLQDNIEDALEEQVFDDVTVEHLSVEDLEADTITSKRGNLVVDSIRGKNIIPSEISSQSISGLTITRYNDGSFKIDGTSTASISRLWIFQGKNIFVKAGTYTLSTHSTGTVNDTVYFVLRNSLDQEMPLTINVKNANSRTNTFNDDVAIMNGYLYIGNNITFNNFVIYPQLEEGDSVSDYAAYQKLNGLETYLAWQNPNVGTQFNAQDVDISNLNEFTYYEIIYKQSTTAQTYNYMQSSGKIPVGQNCCLGGGVLRISAAPRFWARFVTYSSTKLTFSAGYYETTSDNSASTANDIIIPYQILLYK